MQNRPVGRASRVRCSEGTTHATAVAVVIAVVSKVAEAAVAEAVAVAAAVAAAVELGSPRAQAKGWLVGTT